MRTLFKASISLLAAACVLSSLLTSDRAHAADVSPSTTRSDFLKLIDRPRVPPAAEVTTMPSRRQLLEYHFTYAADAHQRVPGILFKSPTGPPSRPVVIALHGTGGAKEDMIPLLRQLALRGFIAIAIDGRYHGERSTSGEGIASYETAILSAWHDQKEHPFFFDTVWDVMRLIDYLDTRPDVDAARIGMYGVSKGGIETYLTAAVDPRVGVAVPCIGLESFKWALDNNRWQPRIETIQDAFDSAAKEAGIARPDSNFVHQFYEKVAPGLDGEFDGPSMAPLIAPRPFMPINGEIDPRTPPGSLKLCTDAAQAAYDAAGVPDHFLVRIEKNTAHQVTPDSQTAAIEWFAKWLKPTP